MNLWDKIKSACEDLSPDCRQAVRMQSAGLDRPLPLRQRVGLWFHVLICQWCRRYGQQIKFVQQAAQEHPDELTRAVPQELSAAARERIKQQLQAAQAKEADGVKK